MSLVVFSLFYNSLNAHAACSYNTTCPAPLQEDFIKNSLKAVDVLKQDKDFQSFIIRSLEQRDTALENKEFQAVVSVLQNKFPTQVLQLKHTSDHTSQPEELYIFVSFSMGEKALLNLAQEAKRWNATLVLRGFIEGSYAKTVKALQNIIIKTGQGFIIDPELFSLFNVKVVPTYVLSKPFQINALERSSTPFHDRIQGHVSLQYALKTFVKEGDLREEAQVLLTQVGAE